VAEGGYGAVVGREPAHQPHGFEVAAASLFQVA
jgi:hypothetical protein